MQGSRIDGLRVAIILSDDFEQVEMTEPRKALEQAGATTVLISPKPGQVTGMNHDEKSHTFTVDMTLDQAEPSDSDYCVVDAAAFPL
jgi:protease I